MHLFYAKANCANRYNGPLLSDRQFHNLGLSFYGRRLEDLGRYEVTGAPADIGRVRTPSLLSFGRTAGSFYDVIDMHGGVPAVMRMRAVELDG